MTSRPRKRKSMCISFSINGIGNSLISTIPSYYSRNCIPILSSSSFICSNKFDQLLPFRSIKNRPSAFVILRGKSVLECIFDLIL